MSRALTGKRTKFCFLDLMLELGFSTLHSLWILSPNSLLFYMTETKRKVLQFHWLTDLQTSVFWGRWALYWLARDSHQPNQELKCLPFSCSTIFSHIIHVSSPKTGEIEVHVICETCSSPGVQKFCSWEVVAALIAVAPQADHGAMVSNTVFAKYPDPWPPPSPTRLHYSMWWIGLVHEVSPCLNPTQGPRLACWIGPHTWP